MIKALFIISVMLFMLWLLGLISSATFTVGIRTLLVIGIIMVIIYVVVDLIKRRY